MLGLTYELTTEIKDAEVNPGNRFTLEWGFSQYLSERLEVAVQGGFNWPASPGYLMPAVMMCFGIPATMTVRVSLVFLLPTGRFRIASTWPVSTPLILVMPSVLKQITGCSISYILFSLNNSETRSHKATKTI